MTVQTERRRAIWKALAAAAILLSVLTACINPFEDSSAERDAEEREFYEICLVRILLCRAQPEGSEARSRCDMGIYLTCGGGANRL